MSAIGPVLLDVLQIAHDLGTPHQELPAPSDADGDGGASAVLIAAAFVLTAVALGALLWLKKRAA